jgi:UDP-2-acetamido-2,6-beta-L-arabino-hexul-4-ose reductase
MFKIGITGQAGFIGTHLFNTVGLSQNVFTKVPFQKDFFLKPSKLRNFVKECDAIIHLAGVNRHNDPETLYKINIELIKKIIDACEYTHSTPHILLSSSTQENNENIYGKSKKDGRILFQKWAERNQSKFTGLIIPNVYGPFGSPYYNSVVATFCHQLTHGEEPKIDVDGRLKLIYVGELVTKILEIVKEKSTEKHFINKVLLEHTTEIKVSELLHLIQAYKKNYFEKGQIPNISELFHKNLWNTFLCYIDHKSFFPFELNQYRDDRGSFVETCKLKSGGQVSFSTTVPGITRGNHFHTRKAERFAVIKGQAKIEIRRIGTELKTHFFLDGKTPSYVDMPIWYTHNITNVGDEELFTIFWINEEYDSQDPDTYFEEV